jgi:hypothetical protein
MLVFSIIEFFIWGYFLTFILWIWTFILLIIGAYLVSKITKNEYVAGVYTFIYFILFGLFSSIQEWVLTDVDFYVYWIRGMSSDLLGAIAGFGTVTFLLVPISKVITNFLETRTTSLTE